MATLVLMSFGYRYGKPMADKIYNVRKLSNPLPADQRKKYTGLDRRLRKEMAHVPMFEEMVEDIHKEIGELLAVEGDVVVAIGCEYGKHRSVCVVEALARNFKWEVEVAVQHRDVERQRR